MYGDRPSADEGGGAARLLSAARRRVSAALADLALPGKLRLSEWEHSTILRLLSGLVGEVEDELRAALAELLDGEGREGLRASLTSAHVAIAMPILEDASVFPDAALVNALLRRTQEHRLQRTACPEEGLLFALMTLDGGPLAGEAMDMLICDSARLDPLGEPSMDFASLEPEVAHDLTWAVAAALKHYLIGQYALDAGEADEAISAAAGAVLAGRDECETPDAIAMRLARGLRDAELLDDQLIGRAAREGGLSLFIAALSLRSDFDQASAREMLSDPEGGGPALLLQSAGVPYDAAAAILEQAAAA